VPSARLADLTYAFVFIRLWSFETSADHLGLHQGLPRHCAFRAADRLSGTLSVTSRNAVSGQQPATLANWGKGNLLFVTALYCRHEGTKQELTPRGLDLSHPQANQSYLPADTGGNGSIAPTETRVRCVKFQMLPFREIG
jgi:hypothetical protein